MEEEVEKSVAESSDEGDEEQLDAFDELFGVGLSKSNSTASLSMGLAETLMIKRESDEDEELEEDGKKPEGDREDSAREMGENKKGNLEEEEEEEEVFQDAEIEPEDPVLVITPINNEVKEDVQELKVDASSVKKRTENEGGTVVFPKYVPKTHEDTWDFSMHALAPNYKNKSMWIEGTLYQKLVEDCLHEMHHVYCECEEKQKVSICRLCHKVFCSNKCYKRAVKAATGTLNEDEKKEEMEPEAEISQAVEPEVSKENTEPHCPQPQCKETVKKSVSKELDNNTNLKANETSQPKEKGGRGHGQKENRNQKKEQFRNRHFEQNQQGGRGYPPPNLWPSQVQIMNAPMRGLETVNSSPVFPRPPHILPGALPFNPNMNPLNLPLQGPPFLRHQFNSQGHFSQSMMNAAQFPQSYRLSSNPNSHVKPNYGPHRQREQMPKTVNNMEKFNEQEATSVYSDKDQTDIPKAPRESEAPVKILRNPRGPGTTNANTYSFSHNQPKRENEESSSGFKTHNHPSSSNTKAPQSTTEFQGYTPPNNSLHVDASSGSTQTAYYTPATQFSQSGNQSVSSQSVPDAGAPQKPRTGGNSDRDELTSRNRNTEGDGYSPRKDNYVKNNFLKTSFTPKGSEMEQQPESRKVNNSPTRGKQFPHSSSSSSINTSEGNGRLDLDRNKCFGSTFRGSQERGGPHKKGPELLSHNLDPSMGNSLNYSASSREKNKRGQSSSSSSLPSRNPSIQSYGSSSSSLNSGRKRGKSDGDTALYRISLDPDMPYGIRLPVKYIRGENFSDFSVIPLKNVELNKSLHSRTQECQKVKMTFFEQKDPCLVQYKSNNEESSPVEWYRGIITTVSGNVGVYLVDLGVVTLVPPEDVFELPGELKMFNPYAIRFRCLNFKLDNMYTDEILGYFDSFVRQTTVKVRVTHKDLKEPHKFAGHLEVLHIGIGKWFDVGVLLQKFGLEQLELGTEQDVATAEMNNSIKPLLSFKTDIPELPIMTYSANATTEISVLLSQVLSLNEFYAITTELMTKRTNIEKQLCSPGVAGEAKSVSCLQDLSYPLFMVIDQSERWVRVKVLEVSTDLKPVRAVVFKVDYGDTLTVPLANLKQLPTKFHGTGCVYKCSLPVKPLLKGRKIIQAALEEPMRYLSALCDNAVPVNLRLFMVDNLNVHIVELFLENTNSGCTFSFEKKGWVTLSHDVKLEQCTRNK